LVILHPRGAGRFVAAAFLLFWLCGWAFGECSAVWILAYGAVALMSREPFRAGLASGRSLLQIGPVLAAGAFLILWLFLWTLGGIVAIGRLFQLVWAEDRLLVEGGGLTLERRRGPFRRRRAFARDQLRRIALTGRQDALTLETPRESVELSRLGTHEEREAAAGALRTELGIPESGPLGETLPKGWEEVITPEGSRAVVPNVRTRKAQSRVAAVLALALASVAVLLARESWSRIGLLPFAILFVLAAFGSGCVAVWLARGRMEWHVASGRVLLRRRFGSKVRDVFTATRFELTTTHNSSDNYPGFTLEGVSDAAGTAKSRLRITSKADPTVPRGLGAYLARAAGIPFEDRTTRGGSGPDFAALLEKSGPLGRFAVRFAMNAQKRKRP
jgi:hypothetical protein